MDTSSTTSNPSLKKPGGTVGVPMPPEAQKFIAENSIPALFEAIMAGVMYQRPSDPIPYIRNCLEKVVEDSSNANLPADTAPVYPWNLFIGEKKRKRMASSTAQDIEVKEEL